MEYKVIYRRFAKCKKCNSDDVTTEYIAGNMKAEQPYNPYCSYKCNHCKYEWNTKKDLLPDREKNRRTGLSPKR